MARAKRAFEALQDSGDCGFGVVALVELGGEQVHHGLGVGVGLEAGACGFQLGAQLGEILDDAVMHDRDALGHVRMGVALARLAMGRPAGVADAGPALQRLLGEQAFQVAQLALGAAALDMAVLHRGDAGRVIAAIFEAPQRIDEAVGDRRFSQDSNDSAHVQTCGPSKGAPIA